MTDIASSSFGFGTAYLGRRHGLRDGSKLLSAAFDGGITHFDTAPMYGLGLAERILGRFLTGRRDAVTVATKVGLPAPPRVSWILPGRCWSMRQGEAFAPMLLKQHVSAWMIARPRGSAA